MNTAELTELHTETINAARLEKTLANIARRAETLFSDGYTLNHNGRLDPLGVNFVHGPKGQMYRVDFWAGDAESPEPVYGCNCAAYPKYGTCKHFQAVALREAEEAMAAEHEAQEADRDAFYLSDERWRNFCDTPRGY